MGHPLKKYVNLTLTLKIPGKSFSINPETGNEEPTTSTTKLLKCTVEAISSSQRQYPGLNAHALYLDGFMVEPKKLPVEVKLNERLNAKFLDPYTNRSIEGEFIFDLVDQPRFKAVSKVLGNSIKGWFQVRA